MSMLTTSSACCHLMAIDYEKPLNSFINPLTSIYEPTVVAPASNAYRIKSQTDTPGTVFSCSLDEKHLHHERMLDIPALYKIHAAISFSRN